MNEQQLIETFRSNATARPRVIKIEDVMKWYGYASKAAAHYTLGRLEDLGMVRRVSVGNTGKAHEWQVVE